MKRKLLSMTMCLSFLTFVSLLRVYYATNKRVSCHDNNLLSFDLSTHMYFILLLCVSVCIYIYIMVLDKDAN